VQKGWEIEKWNEAEMAYTLNSATVGAMGGKLKSGMELKWLTKGWGNQKLKWLKT
jgi:hypothetical protein